MTDNIGELDQLITLRRATIANDGAGGRVETWADFSTDATVWASVRPLFGSEGVTDGAHNATGLWEFKIRNRPDISELDGIHWDGDEYNITRILRMGGRDQYLKIDARRGVAK